ncbi:restriction endonuclease subunit S [Synechococcus elongatus]|uniref:restriction endonuclease subunit S n=1 Tax=Synechococcus elongatus TaxID=32046 RepID=UPI000F7F3E29|nr:restriction endonuclease subunit S [Synechococcus elongatus]
MSFPRYPAYKKQELQCVTYSIPVSWDIKPLKAVTSFNDEVLPESTDPDLEIEYVDIGSVSLADGIEKTEVMKFADTPSRARRIVRDGDVIVSTVRTYLKAIAPIRKPPKNLIASTGFAVIRPTPSIDSHFLSFSLQSSGFIDAVISRSSGVSYPAINSSEMARISIPVPSDEEQIAIASFLDRETAKIDALIAEQQRLIELLQEKRQAVISHAVTKGLNPDAPLKDSGVEWLGQIPAHWNVGKLGYYTVTTTGSTPDRNNPSYWNGEIPWVKTGEVMYQDIYETEEKISDLALQQTSCSLLKPGTLLMALYGQGVTRGRVAMLAVEAACNQACAAIMTDSRINPRFLELFLTKAYEHIRSLGNETTQQNLNLDFVRKLEIVVPPTEEQNKIVDYLPKKLSQFDSLMKDVETEISLLQERRSALISAAVTGQIDVRNLVEAAA